MTVADTIYALSSGGGRAAIAVVRISGSCAAIILQTLTGSVPMPRRASIRRIIDTRSGETLDDALVLWFPGPASVTGEDLAELHLHGSQAVVTAVLLLLSRFPGVRPADAGEFTRRAFLNGKMDLVQIEGLGDLLDARTTAQRQQAYRQMSGASSTVFQDWRRQLLLIRADIEAAVDFVEEPGVAEEAACGIDRRIAALGEQLQTNLAHSATAEVIRDGVRVVLAGRPNTGKSSLLNALAQRDAAIVSSIPGTTRDAIEVTVDLEGFPVILTDTAGLRAASADPIEEEGVRRSHRHISAADVLIWVEAPDIAGSDEPDPGITPDIVVLNKADLIVTDSGLLWRESGKRTVQTSTMAGIGITQLLEALIKLVRERFGSVESSLLVSARQRSVAEKSIRLLNDARELPASALELKAELIRQAGDEIGRLTGRVDVEEWLGAIFSRFCIGK
jgi:tRNA modification GTPase